MTNAQSSYSDDKPSQTLSKARSQSATFAASSEEGRLIVAQALLRLLMAPARPQLMDIDGSWTEFTEDLAADAKEAPALDYSYGHLAGYGGLATCDLPPAASDEWAYGRQAGYGGRADCSRNRNDLDKNLSYEAEDVTSNVLSTVELVEFTDDDIIYGRHAGYMGPAGPLFATGANTGTLHAATYTNGLNTYGSTRFPSYKPQRGPVLSDRNQDAGGAGKMIRTAIWVCEQSEVGLHWNAGCGYG